MTELLCNVCDHEIFENESERNKYLATLRKKNDKSFYTKYTINKVNLDAFDKILNNSIITHNKKYDFYFIKCEFKIEIDNNFTANIEYNYHYNTDTKNIKSYLLFYIDSCESGGYKFSNINYVIINTISCMCNMTYEN